MNVQRKLRNLWSRVLCFLAGLKLDEENKEAFKDGPNFIRIKGIKLFVCITELETFASQLSWIKVVQEYFLFWREWEEEEEEQSLAGEKWEGNKALNTLSLCLQERKRRVLLLKRKAKSWWLFWFYLMQMGAPAIEVMHLTTNNAVTWLYLFFNERLINGIIAILFKPHFPLFPFLVDCIDLFNSWKPYPSILN